MSTSAERQKRWRERMGKTGMVQLNLWLPARVYADFVQAAELCRSNPDLGLGPMRNEATGKLVKRK